jgi:hypothetical protein
MKKGYIHLYQVKNEDFFFIGKSGFTGIKRLSEIIHEQDIAEKQLQQVFEHVQSPSNQYEMELS